VDAAGPPLLAWPARGKESRRLRCYWPSAKVRPRPVAGWGSRQTSSRHAL